MARVNIQESWWVDSRRFRLKELVGSKLLADGIAINLWRVSQDFEKYGRLIPEAVFDELVGYKNELLACDLIIKKRGQIYVRGSKENFEWIKENIASAAKGGKSKRKKPSETEANAKRTPSETEASSSYSSSSSSSSSYSSSSSKSKGNRSARGSFSDEKPPIVSIFIATYVKAFQSRYGTNSRPFLGGKVQGQIKRYAEESGERGLKLIETYLSMDDPWFKTKCHDFTTFLENQNKVSISLDGGIMTPGGIDWQKLEKEIAEDDLRRISKRD